MSFEKKVEEINKCLSVLESVEQFVIWGMGEHTWNLIRYTDLFQFWDKAILVDKKMQDEELMQKPILAPKLIDWVNTGIVLISSLKHQKAIVKELREVYDFKGICLELYADYEIHCFYDLHRTGRGIYFQGDYNTWEQALRESKNAYQNPQIMERMFEDVENHKDQYKPNWFLLYYCLKHYLKYGELHILDFGGGPGAQYFMAKQELEQRAEAFQWYVVDLPAAVNLGRKYFENQSLHFTNTIDEVANVLQGKPCIIYSNACIQYDPAYQDILDNLLQLNAETIIFERLPIGEQERITVQEVHDYIFETSMPISIFDKQFYSLLESGYKNVYEDKTGEIPFPDMRAYYTNLVFERK